LDPPAQKDLGRNEAKETETQRGQQAKQRIRLSRTTKETRDPVTWDWRLKTGGSRRTVKGGKKKRRLRPKGKETNLNGHQEGHNDHAKAKAKRHGKKMCTKPGNPWVKRHANQLTTTRGDRSGQKRRTSNTPEGTGEKGGLAI